MGSGDRGITPLSILMRHFLPICPAATQSNQVRVLVGPRSFDAALRAEVECSASERAGCISVLRTNSTRDTRSEDDSRRWVWLAVSPRFCGFEQQMDN